jgi:peptidoglycan/LPS O-acetylase OafA/YrhL
MALTSLSLIDNVVHGATTPRAPSAGLAVREYQPALDGLRALAITAVVVFHSSNLLPGGSRGVDLFFVLSGFLITSLLMQETAKNGAIDLRAFYARRAIRLWPAFLLVLAATASSAYWSQNPRDTLRAVAISATYLMNWNSAFEFRPEATLGHTWSLAMEEQFYLVWPFLLAFVLPRRPLACTFGLIVAVLALRVAVVLGGGSVSRIYNGFDTHSDGLLIGAALAMTSAKHPQVIRRLSEVAPFIAPAAIFLLVVPGQTKFAQSIDLTFTAIVAASLLVLGMTSRIATRILSLGPLRYTGKISYGWYLWHFPVLQIGAHHLKGGPFLALGLGLASYAIAALSYQFVEKPALRLKARFAPPKNNATECLPCRRPVLAAAS